MPKERCKHLQSCLLVSFRQSIPEAVSPHKKSVIPYETTLPKLQKFTSKSTLGIATTRHLLHEHLSKAL